MNKDKTHFVIRNSITKVNNYHFEIVLFSVKYSLVFVNYSIENFPTKKNAALITVSVI